MITTALSLAMYTPHGGIESRLEPHSNVLVNKPSENARNEARMMNQTRMIVLVHRSAIAPQGADQIVSNAPTKREEPRIPILWRNCKSVCCGSCEDAADS